MKRLINSPGLLNLSRIISSAFIFFLPLIIFPSLSFGETGVYPHLSPSKPAVRPSPEASFKPRRVVSTSRIAVPFLKGIVFISSPKYFNPNGVSLNGISVKGLPFLKTPSFLKKVSSFLNRPLTFKGIKEIVSSVDKIYKERGFPFIDALTPPQDVSCGRKPYFQGRIGEEAFGFYFPLDMFALCSL